MDGGEITRIYEAAAVGLNLLEEYGHPFEVEGFEDMLEKNKCDWKKKDG